MAVKMDAMETSLPGRQRLLRLVLIGAARAADPPQTGAPIRHDLAALPGAQDLCGATVAVEDGWLHWIEGPGPQLCAAMAQIAPDPRLAEARLLSVGWTDRRRFPRWPLRQAVLHQHPARLRDGTAWRPEEDLLALAQRVFDDLAQDHALGSFAQSDLLRRVPDFVERLLDSAAEPALPVLARDDLQARAGFVAESLQRLGQMQEAAAIGFAEVALAQTRLNSLLQRAGRPSQPLPPRGRVCIVMPPGETEMIGTILKADLLRLAGLSVRVILELELGDILDSLRGEAGAVVIVTGSRMRAEAPGGRSARLLQDLRQALPDRLILQGGLGSGPLADCAERLALLRHRAGLAPVQGIDWAAMGSLATLIGAGPQGAMPGVFA
ncbi:BLUF domain-containing protein [Rhodobacter capsulatus]|uniref:hypothetical protein n=1 Tax=Rhodobacter capsulatus TaxID=1061 RepID=UPI0003D3A05E|nr:hypothetical protein [Rhodobacter capsulatus]ETD86757.1 hypothetical protein U713_18355 [Rhodobacter capsulatus YW2]